MGTPRIIFDFTDLVDFVRRRPQLTGIQRVQVELYKKLRKRPELEVVPVYFGEYPKRYFSFDADRLLAHDSCYAENLRPTDGRVLRKLFRRVARLRAIRLKAGDLVFVAGAGWISPRRTDYLSATCKERSIPVHWLLYDMLPITHPEYTLDGTVKGFRGWIDAALQMPSTFLCISHFTQQELLKYIAANQGKPHTVAVPLAHEFPDVQPCMRDRYRYLKSERFVLSVGTLEVRKNQLSLVREWERLYKELGERTPMLVLVGATGWTIDRLHDFLRATGNVFGQVVHINDASDAELAWLYERCEFTVYPSAYEGWGLPVGESFWFG
jgi:glycosyltransferase involved in cell wall biosynthesis